MRLKFSDQLQQFMREAVTSSHAAHGCELSCGPDIATTFPPDAYAVTVGFEGYGERGTLVLAFEAGLLSDSHPMRRADPSIELEDALLADWAGELANLTGNHLKSLLSSIDTKIAIRPPSVTRDPSPLLSEYLATRASQQFWFASNGLRLCCQLSDEGALSRLTGVHVSQ